MLPEKIRKLLEVIYEKTERDELKWEYDDLHDKVTLDTDNFMLIINYAFDESEEAGQFRIQYRPVVGQKDYYFSTSQKYSDYDVVKKLYDAAQSSDLDLDLGFKI